ncbi:MAG: PqqD family protein [Flavobacteriales bacterium]|jgi:hypothetical protein|nr:PqqD family protein [Flavobacteriales bacterium]
MDLKNLQERKPQMAAKVVGGETVLVPLQSNVADLSEMFTLNEVGSFIWEKLDENESVEGLVEAVVSEFEIDNETANTDVTSFLTELDAFLVKA